RPSTSTASWRAPPRSASCAGSASNAATFRSVWPSVRSELPPSRIHPTAFVAPNATVRGDVTIGEGAVVLFGAVLRAEEDRVVVGRETNIQDNAVVHCDAGFPALIRDRVTVGHAAVVHCATVGDGCLVGIGAIAISGLVMGEGSWMTAGSVLQERKENPHVILPVDVPIRPQREFSKENIEMIRLEPECKIELRAIFRLTV